MEAVKIKEIIANTQDFGKSLEPKPVIKCLLSFVGGFLMMNPFVFGHLSPFSISLICALRDACSLWAGAGGIVGSFLFFDGTDAVKYVAAVMMCILIKGLAARMLNEKLREYSVFVNAFLSPFLIGTAIMLATGFEYEVFLSTVFEAVLSCGGSYLFRKAAFALWNKKDISRCTTLEEASILITFGIVLMHFYRYQIFSFSPVIAIFAACVLLCSKIRNGSGGMLCGVCLAFTAGLSGELRFAGAGLALGGFLCGEFMRNNRYICTLGFLAPVCVCAVVDGTVPAYMTVAECALAGAIFLLIPESIFSELCKRFNAPVPIYIKSDDGLLISKKLGKASVAINRVSDCVTAIQRTFKPNPDAELYSAIRSTWAKVCSECELQESCRKEVKNPSDEAVERLALALKNNAQLDETRFPKGFFASCYSFNEMQTKLQSRYIDFSANQVVQGQILQIRGLMSDQFRNMADILKSFADEFDEEISLDIKTADIIAAEAMEFGLDVISADSFTDKLGRISISLNVSSPVRHFESAKLTDSLSNAIGTNLDIPEIYENENQCTLRFSQKIMYSVSIGAYSKPTLSESVCGDYYRSFKDENGRYIIILSDGMGTGSSAAVDSAMTSELFSNLVKSGLSFDCALAVVNSALLVKSESESLATLDAVCIDLYTGKTDFMKAGAAATFIFHRGNIIVYEKPSMPIGILRDISFSKATASLEKGDAIIMLSDGVLGESNGWIQQKLKTWYTENDSPQTLAETIIESAGERKGKKHTDDMTAVVIKIE